MPANLKKELHKHKDNAEATLRLVPLLASWKDHCYLVRFEGLSKHGADVMQCLTHRVPIDVDYKENLGVELKHAELPCVVSVDVDGVPVLYPMEVVFVDYSH